MGNLFSFASRKSDNAAAATGAIGWESRYNGVLSVAMLNDVPLAGISGPWPDGNYALTWWTCDRCDMARKLEFHPSLEHARQRVEEMAGSLACAA
jgi:hypothetical protein